MVLRRPTKPSIVNTKKKKKKKTDVFFITGHWSANVGSQEKPGITGKFGPRVQNEVGQSQQFCQEKTLVIANTLFQQPKRQFYIWTSPHGQYQNQIDNVICS